MKLVVNRRLSSAEMNGLYVICKKPGNPLSQNRNCRMHSTIRGRQAKATPRITKARNTKADHGRQVYHFAHM
jgi:hypothetical protein